MVYKTQANIERISSYGWKVPRNKETAIRHDQERAALQTAITTRGLFICSLKRLDNIIQKPFKEISKEDMLKFMAKRASLKSNSEKKCLKVFFQWLYGLPKGQYPECISWVKFNGNQNGKLPEEMLTKADILKLVQAARLLRDKALIFVLYETGARAGEVSNIKIKHVKFDDSRKASTPEGDIVEWIPVFLRGKTGERMVYIQNSVPILREWLNSHPNPHNPDAPLFTSKNGVRALDGANVIGQIVKRAARASGIKKRVHPHLFRHSRATHLAQSMTEQELKKWFGWTGGSRMPATYTHLSAGDLLEKLKKMNGVETSHDKDPLTPQRCLTCKTVNQAESVFCKQCGEPLDPKVAIAEKEKRKRREAFLDKLLEKAEKDEKWKRVAKEIFA